jgi:hypothetical protein
VRAVVCADSKSVEDDVTLIVAVGGEAGTPPACEALVGASVLPSLAESLLLVCPDEGDGE